MKRIAFLLFALCAIHLVSAAKIETVWPKGKMPHRQAHQIAAMLDEASAEGFCPDKHREAYIEWMPAPEKGVRTDACMILISGGGYFSCCDVGLVDEWNRRFTQEGIQCVKFVYRTPRPQGLPIYQTAWEDAQRAVRLIRSQARKRGINPEKIGVVSQSAGSHLALLLATSSQTPAYEPIDALDTISCHINWAIVNSPAYVTTDAEEGTPATRQGYGVDVKLSSIYKFDARTCPMSLHHGGADEYSPNGSTLIYRELRKRGIPAELHLYPGRPHGAYGLERGVEFMRQMEFYKPLEPEVDIMQRYDSDDACAKTVETDVWPEGKMPDAREKQCKPLIKWYFPKEKKTDAIQIIYSGGSYMGNDWNGFEVAPARRYLNQLGMTVVTMCYRTPRPEGLPKHVTAWQDLQRAIRTVRSEASKYGLDGNQVGIMGSSAGGHLTLMGVTSSMHQSYLPMDDIDRIPCNVQWGIGIYPAYVLKDGADGHNSHGGNTDEDTLVPEFSFDLQTAPMLFIHGDADGYASMGSVKVWEKMRSMGIQSELHTLALRQHCFQRKASPGTGSYTWLDRIAEYLRDRKILP
ncbi:MAG: alpha/beta hydrolase [Bacteroidaceae bacterium]|nr:alpha/beta hydrolase [Bacteroidaceae bacterium]